MLDYIDTCETLTLGGQLFYYDDLIQTVLVKKSQTISDDQKNNQNNDPQTYLDTFCLDTFCLDTLPLEF